MATCGYLCPSCEGRGLLEDGENCGWCIVPDTRKEPDEDTEQWISSVHEGPCCGDLGRENDEDTLED